MSLKKLILNTKGDLHDCYPKVFFMNIWILMFISAVGYAGFQFFSAKAGGRLDYLLSAIVINVVAVIIPLTLLLNGIFQKNAVVTTQKSGLIYAGLAGISIAIFAIAFQKIFQQGGSLSFVSPLIFGGAIALSTILSLLILKESINIYHILGILFILGGIACISLAKAQG